MTILLTLIRALFEEEKENKVKQKKNKWLSYALSTPVYRGWFIKIIIKKDNNCLMRRKLSQREAAVQCFIPVTHDEFWMSFLSALVCQYNGMAVVLPIVCWVDNLWEEMTAFGKPGCKKWRVFTWSGTHIQYLKFACGEGIWSASYTVDNLILSKWSRVINGLMRQQ